MTSLLADIKPWEPYIVPGTINPLYKQGKTVNFKGVVLGKETEPAPQLVQQPKPGLGEDHHLVKQLVSVLQKSQSAPMPEALPQYRRI